MENLGEYIKKEREKKGITLEEAAKATRIGKTYLKAIEEGDFSIQSPVFMKGFLRSYADFLGLDSTDILGRYKGIQEEREGKGKTEEHKLEPVRKSRKYTAVITLSLIVVIIVAAIYTTKEPDVAPPTVKPSQEAELEQQEAAMVNTTTLGTITSIQEKLFQPLTTSPPPATEPSKPVVLTVQTSERPKKKYTLTITAKELSWLRISVDEKNPVEVLMKSGETASWSADRKFVITSEKAAGIDMTLNGKSLGRLGESGKVVTKTIPE